MSSGSSGSGWVLADFDGFLVRTTVLVKMRGGWLKESLRRMASQSMGRQIADGKVVMSG
jgi:hypothetical protein